MKAAGMHLTPTPAYFLIKTQQLRRALLHKSEEFSSGLVYCLDVLVTPSETETAAATAPVELLKIPANVSTRVSNPRFITNKGVEAVDVEIHYGTPDGGGKFVSANFHAGVHLLIFQEDTQCTSSSRKQWVLYTGLDWKDRSNRGDTNILSSERYTQNSRRETVAAWLWEW